MSLDAFATGLLLWHESHGRKDLPWQQDRTPYRVWVSEIMLQQTQVATVIPYYLRFMEEFPDVLTLANATIDRVLKHWSGLGYYARARYLYQAACEIRDRHGGRFPDNFDDVVALPGIGRSTAGAIMALARGERRAILDGNVKRVLARYHAVSGWPGESTVAATLWQHAEQHTPEVMTAPYTQAIMDLGATVCTRTNPACFLCPLTAGCQAFAMGRTAEFPGRREKKSKPLRQTHMALACCNGEVYLECRPPSGIWGGLWSLPEFDLEGQLFDWCRERLNAEPVEVERWTTLRHSFSHYHLDIKPVALHLDSVYARVADGASGIWYKYAKAPDFGIAAPVMKLIENLKDR
ncbi:MAG TPA: A/G-specific adenine glycosylase [Woeseiaceae bacterium]